MNAASLGNGYGAHDPGKPSLNNGGDFGVEAR